MKKTNLINTVVAALVGTGLTISATNALAAPNKKVEKCYGIAKKAMNDCGTDKHACAGQSKMNKDPSEWIYVLKGNCERIVGGSLTPPSVPSKMDG